MSARQKSTTTKNSDIGYTGIRLSLKYSLSIAGPLPQQPDENRGVWIEVSFRLGGKSYSRRKEKRRKRREASLQPSEEGRASGRSSRSGCSNLNQGYRYSYR